jgi:ribosomal protein S18 acetylase RimI-like enzyme
MGGFRMTTKTQLYFVEVAEGQPPTHTISALSGDEPEATFQRLAVIASRAGKDYLTSLYLQSWAVINRLWVFTRNADGLIMGFLTTETLSSVDVLEWNRHLPSNRQIRVSRPALYANDLVVADDHRRLGVASRMLQHVVMAERYGDGSDDGYDTAYAISRVPIDVPEAPNSFNVLRRCGFTDELLRMQGYYGDAHERGWHCPVCDPRREGLACRCMGILMRRTREEETK